MSQNPPPDSKLNDDMVRQTIYTGIRKASLWMLAVILFLGLLSYNLQRENWSVPLERINWSLIVSWDGDSWLVPCGS